MCPETPLTRRRLLQSGVALSTIAIAGCNGESTATTTTDSLVAPGDGSTPRTADPTRTESTTDEQPRTPMDDDTPTVPIGEAVFGETLMLAVQGIDTQPQLDGNDPLRGEAFYAIQLAVRNRTTDEYVSFNHNFSKVLVRGPGGTTYPRRYQQYDVGAELRTEQIAPGELARGLLVFEGPAETDGMTFEVQFRGSAISLDTVTVELDETADTIATFGQDLAVDTRSVGETVSQSGLSVTVTDVRTTDSVGDVSADQNRVFLIPTVRVENDTQYTTQIRIVEDFGLKDGRGNTALVSGEAHAALDNPFDATRTVREGSTATGAIPYEVPNNASPLYFVFDFSIFVDGTRTFWRLE